MTTLKTSILFFCIQLISSCAVQHQTLPILNISHIESFHLNEKDSLYYGYFKDLLALTENGKLKRWAKRKNYQIIGFEVMNTSESFTKGFQLKFYHNNKRANSDLMKDLQENNISYKVLPRGIPVYGIIIIEGNIPLDELHVKLQ